jgi:hypothetical protein
VDQVLPEPFYAAIARFMEADRCRRGLCRVRDNGVRRMLERIVAMLRVAGACRKLLTNLP